MGVTSDLWLSQPMCILERIICDQWSIYRMKIYSNLMVSTILSIASLSAFAADKTAITCPPRLLLNHGVVVSMPSGFAGGHTGFTDASGIAALVKQSDGFDTWGLSVKQGMGASYRSEITCTYTPGAQPSAAFQIAWYKNPKSKSIHFTRGLFEANGDRGVSCDPSQNCQITIN